MQKAIIEEVGKEFGLDIKQAQELFDQYWMEYVIKRIYQAEHDYIFIEGLGTLSIKLKKLLRKRYLLTAKLSAINPTSKLTDEILQKLQKIQNLINYAEKSNSRRNYKRYYG